MHFRASPHRRCTAIALFAAMLGCALGSGIAVAQSYTSQPIKIIVPYTPGTGNDILARTLGQRITEKWKTPVVVENRPGASGNIGTAAVARAAPDGLTLLLAGTGTLASAPSLDPNLGYDRLKSFAPISALASGPHRVVISSSVPAISLREPIELAKSKPGQLNFGSAGTSNPLHFAAITRSLRAATPIACSPEAR